MNLAYLSPTEAAAHLGVTAKTVSRWAKEGRVECVKTLGGHRRFSRETIDRVAQEMGYDDNT